MGIYIDFPDKQKTGKAERLRRDHGAEDFKGLSFADIPEGKVLVCVAENKKGEPALVFTTPAGGRRTIPQEESFDAAAVCFDQYEWDAFHLPDEPRKVHELLLDKEEALRIAPPTLAEALGVR